MQTTRREALRAMTMFAGTLFALPHLSGCSGDPSGDNLDDEEQGESEEELRRKKDGGAAAAKCTGGARDKTISFNHGHELRVSKEDVAAGAAQTYSIGGQADHSHSVTLTAAHFTKIRANKSVKITSTDAFGHSHVVTVSCG